MQNSKISETFKIVFGTVTGITILSGLVGVGMAGQRDLTPQQVRVFEAAQLTWQTGTGALLGLLGGKTVQDDDES